MEIITYDKTCIKSQAIHYRTDAVVSFYINHLQSLTDKAGADIEFGSMGMFKPTTNRDNLLTDWLHWHQQFEEHRREKYPLLGF